MTTMKLYGYFASGASYRLRIALGLKGLAYEAISVDLRGEAHAQPAYRAINPQGMVPTLETPDGPLWQSPAILEWLEEVHPTPPLLPAGRAERARVRAMADIIGCDVHPLNNRRVLIYLRQEFGCDEARINAWCGRWMADGFAALERLLVEDKRRSGFCFGAAPTLAEVFLIPQLASARRFSVDLSPYPELLAVERNCLALPAIAAAAPNLQADYQP